MSCGGDTYRRWSPEGCGRAEMIERQKELCRGGTPLLRPGGKPLKDESGQQVYRLSNGVIGSWPPPASK